MKYLFFSFFSFMALSLQGQTDQLNKVDKLIESFSESQDVDLIAEAKSLMDKVFENESAMNDPTSLSMMAAVETMALEHTEVDDPFKLSDEIESLYSAAFINDKKMKMRQDLLNLVYQSKKALLNLGNKTYEAKSYDEAYKYYQKALKMNDLEVAHPRYASKDYSLQYTAAVFAGLAGKKEESMKIFEELVEVNYDRVDMYDTLINYYTEKDKKTDLMRIKKLKAERYPM